MDKNVKAKKRKKYIPEPFAKIKTPFWKIDDLKDITAMAIPIFIQLLFNIFIAQINLVAINHYKDGAYAEGVAKAILSYNTLQFIPSLISTGTIVVAGNLIGQGRKEEVSKVIVTGLLINFAITSVIFIATESLSDYIVQMMGASDGASIHDTAGNVLEANELAFVSKYYRLININLLILSISQVLVAGLQSMKKSTYVTISAIGANVIDVTIVSILLYATNINPIYSALVIPIAGIFQIIYLIFMNFKFIDFKINKHKQLNKVYAIETLKTGLPITIEMGVWNLCNFATGTAIAKLSPEIGDENPWIVLHRNAQSIGQYSTAFIQAMGTVTSVFVARKIGQNDKQAAYETAINCWKAAIYATIIANILMMAASYPMLEMLGSKGK
ncbi:MATE family efflux transporter [Spiroplasma culicicola]|uniref:MATE efflux family protein n=1 Tax=Spiroplasma culicicola AES-1 TaxID=1276246 RepID=W6A673_9MOLU|nr:MATE family efflux transporter [Spiroplasma culicicola]AHI52618.1 hypothetical protein SCULI_v1c02770 [Spiroplasma culicicola AES-1]